MSDNRIGSLDRPAETTYPQDLDAHQIESTAIIIHELRTPMTSLRVLAHILLREMNQGMELDEPVLRSSLRLIDQQVQHLNRLVGDLVDVSRIGLGKLSIDARPTDLRDLAREIVTIAQERMDHPPIRLSAPTDVVAVVDPLRIEQLLVHLIDNAVQYSPAGTLIDVGVVQADETTARITVQDRGRGIAPEHRERIFERNYQITTGQHNPGLGVGLYICRQIAELHGGTIEVEAPSEGGSCFIVTLPTGGPPVDE